MVLVDTSAWIAHFKNPKSKISPYLLEGNVLTHDFILGELSLGQFSQPSRLRIFERMLALEKLETADHLEVFQFAQKNKLVGKGIGWIDCHLLYASVTAGVPLITLDKNLEKISKQF